MKQKKVFEVYASCTNTKNIKYLLNFTNDIEVSGDSEYAALKKNINKYLLW